MKTLEQEARQLANASYFTYDKIVPVLEACKRAYVTEPKAKCIEILNFAHDNDCTPKESLFATMRVDFIIKPIIER